MINLRRVLMALSVMLVCLLAFPSAKADASARLSSTKATVYVGGQTKLTVKGTSRKVTWTSNDTKVATVKNGKVTAKRQGSAVITAKVGSKRYTCRVTVRNQAINQRSITLTKGELTKVKVNGAYRTVTYKSSNTKVAVVSKYGNVKAVGAGTATINARHNGKNYTCKVTVRSNDLVMVRFEKKELYEESEVVEFQAYLKQLDVKSQKSDKTYVYYTVTTASYKKVLNNISKTIDSYLDKALKSQDRLMKVTLDSAYTKINLYYKGKITIYDKALDAFDLAAAHINYYQLFSGKTQKDVKFTFDVYEYNSNKFLFSIPYSMR